MKGLITMTAYTTRTLAAEVIGKDDKAATRTLRKFLRDAATAQGGKVGVDTPGKGGRYSLNLTKPQLRKMIKDFAAWQVAQEEAKAARAALLADKADKAPVEVESPIEDNTDDEVIEDEDDNTLDTVEGPSDEEIAEMMNDED
jgi:hypothetical protein